jgi:YesN/AraC family two-component response regulator
MTVIVSGYPVFDYARAAVRCAAFDYILKPVNIHELGHCLHRCAEKAGETRRPPAENLLLIAPPDGTGHHSAARLVERIEKYFRANLSGNVSLDMLCAEMNYSKVYLCRVFKKIKGMTPIDYFIRLKIEKARQLLGQYPALPMKDIAASLGFSDVYYFSKAFKRITGFSPSNFRGEGIITR